MATHQLSIKTKAGVALHSVALAAVWFACLGLMLLVVTALSYADEKKDTRPVKAKVIRIVDGDTVTLEVTLRLDDVDCPEKKQVDGWRAIEWMRDNLRGKNVEVTRLDREFYGRFLGQVSVEGTSVNQMLVKNGLCWQYKTSNDTTLKREQQEAKLTGLGIWKNPKIEAPWDWRKRMKNKGAEADGRK